jgi:hypothetical protein
MAEGCREAAWLGTSRPRPEGLGWGRLVPINRPGGDNRTGPVKVSQTQSR